MSLNVATFLLQWATGGLAFLWVTTRRREVSLGYGWLMRGVYGVIALGALAAGRRYDPLPVRDIASAGVVVAAGVALWVSVARRSAGVALQRERTRASSERVAAMTGFDRAEQRFDADAPEFPPILDVVAPAIGLIGLVAGGAAVSGPTWLGIARTVVGAAFLGSVTDAMLLGHWYLTQPGLRRAPLEELVRWVGWTWVPEVVLLLVPPGMVSVLNGTVDDGYGGMLGWFWVASALTTIASFGNLAFSAHVGTASMGILLAVGLCVSMAFTLIVLPAWLKVFGGEARRTA